MPMLMRPMRVSCTVFTVMMAAAFAASVLVPTEAKAATTSPLSALAAMPAAPSPPLAAPGSAKVTETPNPPIAVPGLTLTAKDGHRDTKWYDLDAATGRGYCLVSRVGGMRWMSSWGTSSRSAVEALELDRLVEKDGKASLERTTIHFDPTDASLSGMGTSRGELHEVARNARGVVVWAFKDGRDVVILARKAERGVESRPPESDEGMIPFASAEGCPFAGARLDARKPEEGLIAQLSGTLPAHGEGKDKVVPQFFVDASLSRFARDSEPKLAVRIRVRE